MPEFRWILLGLGLVLLAGIWWWGSRRPSQARGFSELRESEALSTPAMPATPVPTLTSGINPVVREPSISPYEPLRISSLDIPVLAEPLTVRYDIVNG